MDGINRNYWIFSPEYARPGRPLKPGAFAIQSIRNDPSLQPSTKQQYIRALENYLATGGSLLDPMALAVSLQAKMYQ